MTGLAAPRVLTGARSLPAHVAAPVALALWCVLLLAAGWLTWGDLRGDTGYDQVAAARVAAGDLPYADFVYFYGPLVPLLLGGVYSATGTAMGPAIVLGLALALLAVGLTYRLACLIAPPATAAVAAGLVATVALMATNNSYVLAHTIASPLATVLVLAALLWLARWRRTPTTATAVAAGACVGFAALARADVGAALLLALALWLAFLTWAADDRRAALRGAGLVLGVAVAVPLAGYGALLTQVSLGDLLFENLYPRDQVAAAVDASIRAGAPLTVASFAELAARTLAYAALCGGLLLAAAALARGGRVRQAAWALLVVGAIAAVGLALTHPASFRSRMADLYGFVPVAAWLALAALVWTYRRRLAAMPAEAEVGVLGTLFLAGSALGVYAMFTPYPDTGNAPYLWPFAALLMVWLHTRVLARGPRATTTRNLGIAWLAFLALVGGSVVASDARGKSVTVSGPGGELRTGLSEGAAFQGTLDAIARETRPGDPILLAPQLSGLYILAERRSPLAQLTLLPGALPTPGDERRAIAHLHDVRLAVTDRTPLTLYGSGPFGTGYDRVLGNWLRRDFTLAQTIRGEGDTPRTLDIWTRRVP